MKQLSLRILSAFCLTVFFAFSACAATGGYTGSSTAPSAAARGGYTGPGQAVTTVEEAKKMRDDAAVTLRGVLERHLGKDKYLFRDATGTITVEIDHDKWGGQSIGAADQVELRGEVDKDWNSVEIDVDRVIKLAK